MSQDAPAVEAALAAFEGRYPATIELSLGRIEALLSALGDPHLRLPPTVHVAGTNGKGSTCAYLRAIAEAAGLAVHVFSSPHLVRFNERIRLAGKLIDDRRLVDVLARTRAALGDGEITHFEATTAAAFLAFSEVPADVLVLEVGLGGRFDATNVIETADLCVITPVDYDHKQFLGTDLARIAWEKAGIIKRGVPVVSAVQSRVCADVIAGEAAKLEAPLTVPTAADVAALPGEVSLKGQHQRHNAALAAKALQILDPGRVTHRAVARGVAEAEWPARMQRLKLGPVTALAGGAAVWLDGGHNPHAATAIAQVLREMGGRTVLVSAMMGSKDHAGFFFPFEGVAEAVHTMPNTEGHAGAAPDVLAAAARAAIPVAVAHDGFEAAMAAAAARRPDRILICGSLYLAGDVLALNHEAPT
ncbi:MAG: folylpolyglutamate synthase/dihydrofolate synthase family protein [Pseudomonadota bacterium]